jgi:hypothetical protein
MCAHTTTCVLILLYVWQGSLAIPLAERGAKVRASDISEAMAMEVYMCPLTTLYVSSYYYICVLILLYVSSYYYVCVLMLLCVMILLYTCPQDY